MQRNLLVQFLGGGGAVMYFRYPNTAILLIYQGAIVQNGWFLPPISIFIVQALQ